MIVETMTFNDMNTLNLADAGFSAYKRRICAEMQLMGIDSDDDFENSQLWDFYRRGENEFFVLSSLCSSASVCGI